jgi:hypothetical protein
VWKLASTLGGGGSSGGGSAAWGDITGTLANRNDFDSKNNEGSVRVKVEDGSFTTVTDVASAASLCSVFVSVLLTPSADGTFTLRWSNQDGGGATGPTLKKGSWMRATGME